MSEKEHYNRVQEGIMRASFIKQELEEHLTEYYPEKVRELNKSYIEVARGIINDGERFIDASEDFDLGLKMSKIVEGYRNLLRDLGK